MRDIKFRAWFGIPESHLAPSMTYLDVSKFQDQEYFLIVRHSDNLMQYTGLKDKNGVEIYEGDIVSLKGQWIDASGPAGLGGKENQQVEWNKETTGWNPFANYDSDCGVYIEADGCEIIGNIYENPELLKENK